MRSDRLLCRGELGRTVDIFALTSAGTGAVSTGPCRDALSLQSTAPASVPSSSRTRPGSLSRYLMGWPPRSYQDWDAPRSNQQPRLPPVAVFLTRLPRWRSLSRNVTPPWKTTTETPIT